MMQTIRRLAALVIAVVLMGAAPRHVLTADYWAGYAGTKTVPADVAARWLSWVETAPADAARIAPLGVKTLLYSNPNRVMPGDSMYTANEAQYAHDCMGIRARGEAKYKGMVLTNPGSEALSRGWKHFTEARAGMGHFDAVFNDEATGIADAVDTPCGFTFEGWLRDENRLQRSIGFPVVYNGLGDFHNRGVAREIALNASAIGGMMEECYAQLDPEQRVGGWKWLATQETELRMAREHKYFFCYGRDLTPADQAYAGRMYTYASFLLTYDPNTTVLWEYYKTPSGAHVMPESQLVAWNPTTRSVPRIDRLRNGDGVYTRQYRTCYINARPVGPCVAAVNPDNAPHRLNLRGFNRTLVLQGSGVFDGGTVRISNARPPGTIAPLQGVIAFR